MFPAVPLVICPFTMSNHKSNPPTRLTYTNWNLWERYVKSIIHCKNAYIVFDPMPIDPSAQQQVVQAATTPSSAAPGAAATIPTVTVAPAAMAEEMKVFCEEMKEWRVANNIMAGVILGSISEEVEYIINPEELAKDMYDKLRVEILKQSSGSSAYSMQIKLIYKKFKDPPHLRILKNTSPSIN